MSFLKAHPARDRAPGAWVALRCLLQLELTPTVWCGIIMRPAACWEIFLRHQYSTPPSGSTFLATQPAIPLVARGTPR